MSSLTIGQGNQYDTSHKQRHYDVTNPSTMTSLTHYDVTNSTLTSLTLGQGNQYDTSHKQRTPAYCDRVLYKG